MRRVSDCRFTNLSVCSRNVLKPWDAATWNKWEWEPEGKMGVWCVWRRFLVTCTGLLMSQVNLCLVANCTCLKFGDLLVALSSHQYRTDFSVCDTNGILQNPFGGRRGPSGSQREMNGLAVSATGNKIDQSLTLTRCCVQSFKSVQIWLSCCEPLCWSFLFRTEEAEFVGEHCWTKLKYKYVT